MNKKNKSFGLKGLGNIYNRKLFFKGAKMPAVICVVLAPLIYFTDISYYVLLTSLAETCIDLIPGLLGFILGGYTILIGFGDTNFLKWINRHHNNSNYSLYSKLNGVFAFVIIFQLATLIFSFLVLQVSNLNVSFFLFPDISEEINLIAFIFLFFMLLYSLISVKDIVINVFNFGVLFGKNKESQND